MRLSKNRDPERGHSCLRGLRFRNSRTWRSARLPLLLTVCSVCLSACATKREPLTVGQRTAIYERANLQFAKAALFKPLEAGPTNTLAFRLAPLFIQEVVNTNAAIMPPLVFFEESKVLLNGKSHDQVIYFWRAPPPANSTGTESLAQGIRITLDTSGSPVIWEVLADDSGGELIFVSQSLEAAALKTFGSPLPGRRYASESNAEIAPNAVVARVIEDGPVTMGPIVHLNADSHNVSTLVCRCMPTQAKELVATETYGLRLSSESKLRPVFGQTGEDAAARLQRCLRLPLSF